jgi:hypothetical protein
MPDFRKRGVILFVVIGVVLVVSILSTAVLRIIANHARLTHHVVSRIQAEYAAKAGIVYALEMLRTKNWTFSPTNSCPSPTGCTIEDADFPFSILDEDDDGKPEVHIIFCPPTPGGEGCQYTTSGEKHYCVPPSGIEFCIYSTVDFTYSAT